MNTFFQSINEGIGKSDIVLQNISFVLNVYLDNNDINVKLTPLNIDDSLRIKEDFKLFKNISKDFISKWRKQFGFKIVEDVKRSKDLGGMIFNFSGLELSDYIKKKL